ncbi:hypothetical protein BEWA_020590 [Theileria equi strain WA]|uniref:Uncharacterized protein n=1 Tax=Theileria equi strain WA TaxID=1537102 RepID=L0AU93_THEEQ|nr:hypothetical protein BEWA_020590 [Theileria equi strain WA]AFZ79212.1 hypothetical protein BEWA_020590 [Theileria equi strain WA]|eukprot:XP_004828878.1 hypothetical protein BEWA_020590 [Theileria equi strain WA]
MPVQSSSDSSIGSDEKATITEKIAGYKTYVIPIFVLGNAFWGFHIFKRINRMLNLRYSNIIYQIRRPESIKNRFTSFKYLILGGSVLPLSIIGSISLSKRNKGHSDQSVAGILPTTGENTISVIDTTRHNLSNYIFNANKRVELFANAFKDTLVPEKNLKGINEDLKRDIAKLKSRFF